MRKKKNHPAFTCKMAARPSQILQKESLWPLTYPIQQLLSLANDYTSLFLKTMNFRSVKFRATGPAELLEDHSSCVCPMRA